MRWLLTALLASLLLAAGGSAQEPAFGPGERVLLDAHNCYPYHGLWTDRLDRALSTGTPLGIEADLVWHVNEESGEGRVLVAHGKPVTGREPVFRDYFFERVRDRVEAALRNGVRRGWPLFVLNICDIRSSEDACFVAVKETLSEYEDWLCTAERTDDPARVMPLRVRPVLVLAGGGQAKRFFHDEVPAGGRLHAFGRAQTNPVPHEGLSAAEKLTLNATIAPEKVLSRPADNFHRWWNNSWYAVERGGANQAGEWTESDRERLEALVEHGHGLGYWVRFYTLNGHAPGDNNGWSPGYNFGSKEAVRERWHACIEAGADFIATDQYEALGALLRKR